MRGKGATISMDHRVQIENLETGAGDITDEESARDFACARNNQGSGGIPFTYVMPHQDDPQKM